MNYKCNNIHSHEITSYINIICDKTIVPDGYYQTINDKLSIILLPTSLYDSDPQLQWFIPYSVVLPQSNNNYILTNITSILSSLCWQWMRRHGLRSTATRCHFCSPSSFIRQFCLELCCSLPCSRLGKHYKLFLMFNFYELYNSMTTNFFSINNIRITIFLIYYTFMQTYLITFFHHVNFYILINFRVYTIF